MDEGDEEALKWKLLTYDIVQRGILEIAEGELKEVDVKHIGNEQIKVLLETLVIGIEEVVEKFLYKLKDQVDWVVIITPTTEVRYEHLNVEAEVYVGDKGLPTTLNSMINILEALTNFIHMLPCRKTP